MSRHYGGFLDFSASGDVQYIDEREKSRHFQRERFRATMKPKNKSMFGTYQITLSALLVAIMLVLGYIESLLPAASVPGIKLGLSNGVLIFAVYMLGIPLSYILMILKVVLSGLLFGGVSAMMYAMAGGLTSLTCMILLSRAKGISPITVSMVGGVTHNIGQVAMAFLVLSSPEQLLYYLAILMLVGLACGALTGIAAKKAMTHLRSSGIIKPPEARSRRDTAFVLCAILVLGLLFFGAYRSMRQASPVTVTVYTSAPARHTSTPSPDRR